MPSDELMSCGGDERRPPLDVNPIVNGVDVIKWRRGWRVVFKRSRARSSLVVASKGN